MNIFIIARGYPSIQEPTWGCFEKDQAVALAHMGHQVTILSVDTRFRFYWRKLGIQHHISDKIAVFNIFLLPYTLLFFLPRRIKDTFFAWQLECIYKRAVQQYGKPDVIYSHYLYNTAKAIGLRNKYQIPLIAIEHWSQMAYKPIPKTTITLAKRVYSYVDQLLTVSSALQQNILEQVGIDSIVVPNMVGKEFYYQQQAIASKVPTIISTGRLVPEKHFDLLIKAIADISKPIQLYIIGSGKEKDKLQQLIDTLHLEQKVHLLGHKSKQEIVSLLQQSDMFVLPSQSETFGVAYIEALACGLPIIATDCGGPRDIVTTTNGLLIPTNNQLALKEAIIQMLQNLHLYNKHAIAEDCQRRFSSVNVAKRIIEIFEKITKTAKK